MEMRVLVEKLWNLEASAIKFIEQYYAQELKDPKLKIELTTHSQTSFYSREQSLISISSNNLEMFVRQYRDVSFKLFYSLIIHEVGHAIYTSALLIPHYSDFLNILEDNRLEFQISMWNKRVRFNLLSYILQDKQLNDSQQVERSRINPTMIGLGLMRTVDNSLYVDYYNNVSREKVSEILNLNNKYMFKSVKAKDMTKEQANELATISIRVKQLCEELAEGARQTPPPPPPPIKIVKGKGKSQVGKGTNNSPNEPQKPEPKEKQELEQELEDTKQENSKLRAEILNGVGLLKNTHPTETTYDKLDIKAFETLRSSGIKGTGFVGRYSGTAKELSLRNYSRRNFVKNTKPFIKQTNFSSGGKTSSVLFYLDISGSMSGTKLKVATDYLKSFYDSMNKNLNIRFLGFGVNTYEFGREELDRFFLEDKLEGQTKPSLVKIKPNEEIVILTDGHWNVDIPEQYKQRANFVIIDAEQVAKHFSSQGCRNVISVDIKNIKEGLDRATRFIKKVLN
jgi:hypothetical protein